MARPAGVVRSSASVSETKPTPRCCSSWSVETRSATDRPQRSKRHTSTTSISRRRAAAISVVAQLALRRAGADLFDLRDDGPAALGGVFAHGADLQRQCLLIVRGNAGVKADPKGVAKNLPGCRLRKSLFCGHFRSVAESGRKLMIVAGLSLFEEVPGHPRRRIRRQLACVPL